MSMTNDLPAEARSFSDRASFRVLLVDDHRAVRDGLRLNLSGQTGIEVVGDTGQPEDVLPMVESLRPTLVILDIWFHGRMLGFQICRQLKQLETSPYVLIATGQLKPEHWMELHLCGVDGFIQHGCEHLHLPSVVRQVHSGMFVLPPELHRTGWETLLKSMATCNGNLELLMADEETCRILDMLAAGKVNKEIAMELGKAPGSINNKLTAIYEMLGVNTRKEAIHLWVRIRSLTR